MKEYDLIASKGSCPVDVRQHLVEMLVSASRFSTTSWKLQSIKRAKSLLDSVTHGYLHAAVAYRDSSLARMTGDRKRADEILEHFIHLSAQFAKIPFDPRYNAYRVDLIISHAQNLIQQSDLTAGREELSKWLPLIQASPSTMEQSALRSRNITLGKILRYEGRFAEALAYLEEQLRNSDDEDVQEATGWRHLLLSNVTDLYTELNRPEEAEVVLERELMQMVSRDWSNSGSSKRLQLSLIEAFMRSGKYKKATEWLLPLKDHFEKVKEPDVLTKRGSFRVWTTLARIAHFDCSWNDALAKWRKALGIVGSLGGGQQFSGGQVKCAIAYTLYHIGKTDEGLDVLKEARLNLASQDRFFYIVGFDSYWHDNILQLVSKCYGK